MEKNNLQEILSIIWDKDWNLYFSPYWKSESDAITGGPITDIKEIKTGSEFGFYPKVADPKRADLIADFCKKNDIEPVVNASMAGKSFVFFRLKSITFLPYGYAACLVSKDRERAYLSEEQLFEALESLSDISSLRRIDALKNLPELLTFRPVRGGFRCNQTGDFTKTPDTYRRESAKALQASIFKRGVA
jgi:hypothetical protein